MAVPLGVDGEQVQVGVPEGQEHPGDGGVRAVEEEAAGVGAGRAAGPGPAARLRERSDLLDLGVLSGGVGELEDLDVDPVRVGARDQGDDSRPAPGVARRPRPALPAGDGGHQVREGDRDRVGVLPGALREDLGAGVGRAARAVLVDGGQHVLVVAHPDVGVPVRALGQVVGEQVAVAGELVALGAGHRVPLHDHGSRDGRDGERVRRVDRGEECRGVHALGPCTLVVHRDDGVPVLGATRRLLVAVRGLRRGAQEVVAAVDLVGLGRPRRRPGHLDAVVPDLGRDVPGCADAPGEDEEQRAGHDEGQGGGAQTPPEPAAGPSSGGRRDRGRPGRRTLRRRGGRGPRRGRRLLRGPGGRWRRGPVDPRLLPRLRRPRGRRRARYGIPTPGRRSPVRRAHAAPFGCPPDVVRLGTEGASRYVVAAARGAIPSGCPGIGGHRSGAVGTLPLQLLLGDPADVHRVRAVDDAQRAGVRVEAGQRGVVADAGAAVQLDRPVDDVQRHPRGGDLDRGDLGAGTLGAELVDQVGGLEHQQAGLVDLDPRLGDGLAHGPLLGQRAAEGDPRLGPLDHQRQGALGHADGAHAVVDAAGAEPGLGDHEPVALAGEDVGPRHPDVGEAELRVPVLVLVPEDRQVPDDLQAGGVPGHEHHRLLVVRRAVRVGLPHDDEDLAPLVGGPAGPPLAAVDHVVVAVADDRGLDVAGVRATPRPAPSWRTRTGSRPPAAGSATAASARRCRTT